MSVLAGLLLASGACGSSTQRAVISPVSTTQKPAAPSAPIKTTTPGGGEQPLAVTPSARRYNLDPQRTKLEMFASDIMTGEHRGFFQRWRGHVDIVPVTTTASTTGTNTTDQPATQNIPSVAAISAVIETDSLVVDLAGATEFVKQRLLEVHRFPHATLAATLSRSDSPIATEHIVQGVADIHGVKKQIRFLGDLTKEGDSYRFRTSFVISRKDFDVRYTPVEPFLKDDVRILIDGVAHPEKVTAEEIHE